MKYFLPLLSMMALLTWPPAATASDPSGLVYVLGILVLGVPFLVGSIVGTMTGCLKKKYVSRTYAVNHVVISSFFLTIGLFAFLVELLSQTGALHLEETLLFAGVLVALPGIFVVLPWVLHMWQRKDGLDRSFKPKPLRGAA